MPAILTFLLLSASGAATAAPPTDRTENAAPDAPAVRLTPEQVEDVLADARRRRESAADVGDSPSLGIHGEVGFEVGSDGARTAFGAATIPLGDDAVAKVYYETSRWPGYRRARRTPY